jgi:hypothetical protein
MKQIAVAIFVLSATVMGARGSSIILDSSFETPALGTGNAQYTPSGSDWAFTGRSGISNNDPDWTSVPAPDGLQVAFLQGFGGVGAMISQELTDLVVGDVYEFSFYLASRPGGYTPNSIEALLGSSDLGIFTPASTSFSRFTSAPVTATSSAMELQFVGSTVNGDDINAFLDLVQVSDLGSPAPEPATSALALMTLLVIGAIRLRSLKFDQTR